MKRDSDSEHSDMLIIDTADSRRRRRHHHHKKPRPPKPEPCREPVRSRGCNGSLLILLIVIMVLNFGAFWLTYYDPFFPIGPVFIVALVVCLIIVLIEFWSAISYRSLAFPWLAYRIVFLCLLATGVVVSIVMFCFWGGYWPTLIFMAILINVMLVSLFAFVFGWCGTGFFGGGGFIGGPGIIGGGWFFYNSAWIFFFVIFGLVPSFSFYCQWGWWTFGYPGIVGGFCTALFVYSVIIFYSLWALGALGPLWQAVYFGGPVIRPGGPPMVIQPINNGFETNQQQDDDYSDDR